MFSSIQRMIHKIRTTYGDSEITYGGDDLGAFSHYPQGVLQGNASGPTVWILLSSVVFEILCFSVHQPVQIDSFATSQSVDAIVKGLRAMTDFDYEFQMAQANSTLKGFETIFIPSSPEYGYLSSSMVKEIHSYGGDISSLVPKNVLEKMKNVWI